MSDMITLNLILRDQMVKGNLSKDSCPSSYHWHIVEQIAACNTELFGMVKHECEECGYTEIHYGTCRNPHCPNCGEKARQKWIENQHSKAIQATVFHIVFTIPDKYLNRLSLHDPRFVYNAMFGAPAKALKELCADQKYFGIEKAGFFSCLHTWGSNLHFHPHVHVVLYGAGLDGSGQLVKCKNGKKYLFPAKKAANLFKKNLMTELKKKFEYTGSAWLQDLADAQNAEWNVQINKGIDEPKALINYLSLYVKRVALSNRRILKYEDDKVTFEYKDYRDHGDYVDEEGNPDRSRAKKKQMTLDAEEFIRRFMQHILPPRFRRVRFYGFLAPTERDILAKMKRLTGTKRAEKNEEDADATKQEPCCKKCGHPMKLVQQKIRQTLNREKRQSYKDLISVLLSRLLNTHRKD